MTLKNIDIHSKVKHADELLQEEKNLSPELRSTIQDLLLIITSLANRLNLNSSNSSNPPSTDPNRKKENLKKGQRKPGGQQGHLGTTLKKVDDPDEIKVLRIDKRTLPPGKYKEVGFESRQEIDIRISRVVIEYRAEILEDESGNCYVAEFPEAITRPVQYGNTLKANAVYMSQFQLVPYHRVQDHFISQMNIPISMGSLCNFNQEAFDLLETFESIAIQNLIQSTRLNVDETGINLDGKRIWLHSVSNDLWTYFYPHQKRGAEAMKEIGILPQFKGTLCHDHWKPYYTFEDCIHSLCNGHHLRELQGVWEQEHLPWALNMKKLLEEINGKVHENQGHLNLNDINQFREQYRTILDQGNNQCPLPKKREKSNSRGRLKKTKSRNLLERLRDYEDDVLRFMCELDVPFTNNLAERDIRMTKVQQKISGCFRSIEGAKIFCRIRAFLSTCRKHAFNVTDALKMLFDGQLPEFIRKFDSS